MIYTPQQHRVIHYIVEKLLFTTSACPGCFDTGADSLTASTVAALLLQPHDASQRATIVADVEPLRRAVPLFVKGEFMADVPAVDNTYHGVSFYVRTSSWGMSV